MLAHLKPPCRRYGIAVAAANSYRVIIKTRRVCETRMPRRQQSQNMAKSLSPTF